MSKEASKKRREAESRLVSELLSTLPAFEIASRRNSSSKSGQTFEAGPAMGLSISATLPTLRYAAVFARKQALLSAPAYSMADLVASAAKGQTKLEPGADLTRPAIRRSELPGFIVVFDPTKRVYSIANGAPLEVTGEMVYVSENVMTYLGHSIQDILSRADSVYDLLLPDERRKMSAIVVEMLQDPNLMERVFLCRFSNALFTRRVRHMNADFKLMLVRARLLISGMAPLVVLSCCPVLTPLYQRDIDFLVHEPGVFTFQCSPELVITRVDNRAGQFLAFTDETELLGRRWLNLVHPDDLVAVSDQLRGVLGPNKRDDAATMFVARLIRAGDPSAPTSCIFVSVVLAYRHFGGTTVGSNAMEVSADDDTFSETCQPSVSITCQVLPDNNGEIANEIRKYVNPLFNCHGLGRGAAAAVAAPVGSSQNNMPSDSETSNHHSRHFRRYHAARRSETGLRASMRSSIASFDGVVPAYDYDNASSATAPASRGSMVDLSRFQLPSRRASAVSAPGYAVVEPGRMVESTSDYNLYVVQQPQQPLVKRQRTTEMLQHEPQSPMSAQSYGTPPMYIDMPQNNTANWTMYQQRWDQMSDTSVSTGYQAGLYSQNATVSSQTPQGSVAFSTGVVSSNHMFNKNANAANGSNPYRNRVPVRSTNQAFYAASPASVHSLEQQFQAASMGGLPKSNSITGFFFDSSNLAPVAAPVASTHRHSCGSWTYEAPRSNFDHQRASLQYVNADAFFVDHPPQRPPAPQEAFTQGQHAPLQQTATLVPQGHPNHPTAQWVPQVETDNWNPTEPPPPVRTSKEDIMRLPPDTNIHESLVRTQSIKRVEEWLRGGGDPSAAAVAPTSGVARVATGDLSELNNDDLSFFFENEEATPSEGRKRRLSPKQAAPAWMSPEPFERRESVGLKFEPDMNFFEPADDLPIAPGQPQIEAPFGGLFPEQDECFSMDSPLSAGQFNQQQQANNDAADPSLGIFAT